MASFSRSPTADGPARLQLAIGLHLKTSLLSPMQSMRSHSVFLMSRVLGVSNTKTSAVCMSRIRVLILSPLIGIVSGRSFILETRKNDTA